MLLRQRASPIMGFEGDKINKVITEQQRLIEKEIENKIYEIIDRYSKYNRKNFEPKRYNKKISNKIGEYDNISYIEEINTILNIECKYITPAFVIKDAQRNGRKIYGNNKEEGYIDKQIRRYHYLKDNLELVFRYLQWRVDYTNPPKIVNLFVTIYDYLWTSVPSEDNLIQFLRVDEVDEYIKNIIKFNKSNS